MATPRRPQKAHDLPARHITPSAILLRSRGWFLQLLPGCVTPPHPPPPCWTFMAPSNYLQSAASDIHSSLRGYFLAAMYFLV